MGYLSQKKHQKRENFFLWLLAVFVMTITAVSIFYPKFDAKYLFYLYCLTGILFVYAGWVKKYKFALFFVTIFIINYTSIAAYANIFISDDFDGAQSLEITFDPDTPLSENFSKEHIISSGKIILANQYTLPYITIDRNNPLTIIRVNLLNVNFSEYDVLFKHLNEFIIKEDNPVIVFGNFGIPAWSLPFKKFLDVSNLTVKNRLIFNDGVDFNFFSNLGFYVLGFKDMGISEISRENADNNSIKFIISFNLEET